MNDKVLFGNTAIQSSQKKHRNLAIAMETSHPMSGEKVGSLKIKKFNDRFFKTSSFKLFLWAVEFKWFNIDHVVYFPICVYFFDLFKGLM